MAPAQTKRIQFTARTPVAIHEGLILAPGTYPGTVTRIGVPAYGGDLSWKAPQYKIELTGAQLTAMGQRVRRHAPSPHAQDHPARVRLGRGGTRAAYAALD